MKIATLLTAPLAALVLSTTVSISDALAKVNKDTVTLGAHVGNWNGKPLGTLPIVADSTTLLADIKKGTKAAKATRETLTTTEALNVAASTMELATNVNTTLTNIIAAKRKFDKLALSPVILLNLKLQQQATAEMSEQIIAKVPTGLQAVAEILVKPIEEGFVKAIDVYDLF
ncbi:hydrophobic surface binding protein A-domain-containing protein [Apodospora peruviana]|uniref:Hydrophobic surface binding protein A-domain-containing protein n=1 Tax=Apodospora peruviana TaxID=516989 RepID=A0AAE0M4D7_9PEZI|nr:hydrophobic surface binding protein A-domain-containing protein [Apodospora peruviana]